MLDFAFESLKYVKVAFILLRKLVHISAVRLTNSLIARNNGG